MMLIDEKFSIGQIVYLKTDPDQVARIVTGIIIRESSLLYYLTYDTDETTHFSCEITSEKEIKLHI